MSRARILKKKRKQLTEIFEELATKRHALVTYGMAASFVRVLSEREIKTRLVHHFAKIERQT